MNKSLTFTVLIGQDEDGYYVAAVPCLKEVLHPGKDPGRIVPPH